MTDLVLYGCSMISGFACTADIPASCIRGWSVIDRTPMVTLPTALRERGLSVEVCALPGINSETVEDWFNQVPQWHHLPTVFWVGRNDYANGCADTVERFRRMAGKVTGSWWILPAPYQPRDEEFGSIFDRVNGELQKFAGERFLDPLLAIGGQRILPRRYRADRVHPSSECNRLIADWLITHTIGTRHGNEHKRAA